MNKRLIFTFVGAVVSSGCKCVMAANQDGQKRMNVLLVMCDDLRPELGCYGVEAIRTPNIDRFAAQSLVFDNAYCNIPVSGASRASLFTGMYPKFPHRFVNYTSRISHDAPNAIALSQWFTSHGYHTISNGKVIHHVEDKADTWSEAPWRLHPKGYDVYWAEYNKWELWLNSESGKHMNPKTMRGPFSEMADVPDTAYDDGHVMLKTISDLRRLKSRNEPFFLACGFWKPHLPFCAPKKYWDLYDRASIPMASNRYRPKDLPDEVKNSNEINAYARVSTPTDEAFLREVKHGYYACVSYVDALFGRVMEELNTLGLADNTIVVLLGDHGWNLGEHGFVGKHNLMDCATRIPLIVHVPGMEQGKSASMVELVDLYPTLCDLCHLPKPVAQLEGISFLPVLKDKKTDTKRNVFVQWEGGDNFIDGRYSYAEWPKSGHRMLFDHQEDAAENKNVVGEIKYSKVVNRAAKTIRKQKNKYRLNAK
ncbi:arylsulfatase [Prevotella sp. DNF00663]|nr:iduronate-2-sulfatase [Prevotella sp. S7 MS 2]KXB84962.1 arylsulfatase [Prevotella sp. DNF00663]